MVSSARAAIACILFIFGTSICAYSQTKGPTASISGKVTIKGKGAPGIVVGLQAHESSYQRPTRYKAVTDDQGNYKIANILPGHYQVLPVAPAYALSDELARRRSIIISKDEAIENVDLALVRGGVITGKVTDADGRPLIEESVAIYPVHKTVRVYSVSFHRTDDRGVYRIYGLRPGSYHVAAGSGDAGRYGARMETSSYKLTYHPDATDIAQASTIEVTEGSETTNVDITLGRPMARYSARGRIVDGETGKPVSNVRYGVQHFESDSSTSSMLTGVVSNSNGEFKLEHLMPGKYAVFIEANNELQADYIPFEVIDQDITGLLVKTSKAASVSGVLVLEGTDDKAIQAGLGKVRVHAYIMDDERAPSSDIHSSAIAQDGSFRVGGLKGGTLAFSLSNHGRFQVVRVERNGILYPKGMAIKYGEHLSGIRVVVNYGSGTVRGVLKVEGTTLPQNAWMNVALRRLGEDPESVNQFFHHVTVDARGQFVAEGVIPGNYEVNGAIYVPGTRGPWRRGKQEIVVTEGSVTNVTLTMNLSPTSDRP